MKKVEEESSLGFHQFIYLFTEKQAVEEMQQQISTLREEMTALRDQAERQREDLQQYQSQSTVNEQRMEEEQPNEMEKEIAVYLLFSINDV